VAVLLTTRRFRGALGGVLSPGANEAVSVLLNERLPDGSSARTRKDRPVAIVVLERPRNAGSPSGVAAAAVNRA
jgi:hypothetical protein